MDPLSPSTPVQFAAEVFVDGASTLRWFNDGATVRDAVFEGEDPDKVLIGYNLNYKGTFIYKPVAQVKPL